jgi:hypothetical protein
LNKYKLHSGSSFLLLFHVKKLTVKNCENLFNFFHRDLFIVYKEFVVKVGQQELRSFPYLQKIDPLCFVLTFHWPNFRSLSMTDLISVLFSDLKDHRSNLGKKDIFFSVWILGLLSNDKWCACINYQQKILLVSSSGTHFAIWHNPYLHNVLEEVPSKNVFKWFDWFQLSSRLVELSLRTLTCCPLCSFTFGHINQVCTLTSMTFSILLPSNY